MKLQRLGLSIDRPGVLPVRQIITVDALGLTEVFKAGLKHAKKRLIASGS